LCSLLIYFALCLSAPTPSPTLDYSTLEDIYLCDFIAASNVQAFAPNWVCATAAMGKCLWTGVQCVSGALDSIDLNTLGISGSLPSSIGQLSKLKELILHHNKLAGRIPTTLGSMSKLSKLHLNNNLLTQSIPSSLNTLSNLEELMLSNNTIAGTLPLLLQSLSKLRYFRVSMNAMYGSIPPEYGQLTNLVQFDVAYAGITTTIPSILSNLQLLTLLDLSGNWFSHAIPDEVWSITRLQSLNLRDNQLDSTISSKIGALKKLTTLNLAANFFSGTIPKSILNITGIKELELQYNPSMSSVYPEGLCSITSLTKFYLTQAAVHQCILVPTLAPTRTPTHPPTPPTRTPTRAPTPPTLFPTAMPTVMPTVAPSLSPVPTHAPTRSPTASPTSFPTAMPTVAPSLSPASYDAIENAFLCDFIASTNVATRGLSGWTCATASQKCLSWGGVTCGSGAMVTIDLTNNAIRGSLPSSVGSLSKLIIFVLSNNLMNGTIPSSIGGMSKLTKLQLDSNSFSKTIPASTGSLSNLILAYFHINKLTGSLPSTVGSLTNIWTLTVNSNKLTGSIPTSIGSMVGLRTWYTSSNKMTGALPTSIGKMTNLADIRLSGNSYIGIMPSIIGNCKALTYINLASNSLNGTLPTGFYSLTNLKILVINDNLFSGSILSAVGSLTAMYRWWGFANRFVGSLPSTIASITALQELKLYGNSFNGVYPAALCSSTTLTSFYLTQNTVRECDTPTSSPTFAPTIYTTPSGLFCGEVGQRVIAGTGVVGSDDGVGTSASFNTLGGMATSPDGTYILLADVSNNRIRKMIISTGVVTTFAGSGTAGGANGIGTNAQFKNPNAVSIATDGTFALTVCGLDGNRLRKIALSTAAVTTIAGVGTSGIVNGIGTNARFSYPSSVGLLNANTNAIIADFSNNVLRTVDMNTFQVTTTVGAATPGAANGVGTSASFNGPNFLAVSPANDFVIVSEYGGSRLRKVIVTSKKVTALAGSPAGLTGSSDGVGTLAGFKNPYSIVFTSDGAFIYVADANNNKIRRMGLATQRVTTLVSATGMPAVTTPTGLTWLTANSALGVTTNIDSRLFTMYGVCAAPTVAPTYSESTFCTYVDSKSIAGSGTAGSANGVGTSSSFDYPYGIATSPDGSYVLIAEFNTHKIRKLSVSTGVVSTFAGGGSGIGGGENGVGTSATFNNPHDITFSSDGLFALSICATGARVRRIEISTAMVTTIAGDGTFNSANGIGTMATFNSPTSVRLYSSNLFALIADRSNHLIRSIYLTTLQTVTVAGSSVPGDANGVGTLAGF
jgi:Leucine-rich repeat (LRR) protein/sugar lactone lactonase YvrE